MAALLALAAAFAQGYGESPYLFGLHDPGGERHMAEKGRKGWILFTEAVGRNPADLSGRDYRPWADQGYGILVRLNHGYGPTEGTIPYDTHYDAFAQRCANFVAASRGAHLWLIGNETNLSIEWPRYGGFEQRITPAMYASCYLKCRARIKALAGRSGDAVLPQATGPWNVQSGMGWVEYHVAMLEAIGAGNVDGIALHTYTHGSDPALVWSEAKMAPPYQNRHYNFRAYRDFLGAHPAWARTLPVYLTETGQAQAWLDANTGWVRNAYAEIHAWNQTAGTQKIRSLILYRWRNYDAHSIEFKNGVIEDFRAAMNHDYRWTTAPPPPPPGFPDVVVDSISTSPSGPVAGQPAAFACVVRNAGGAATPGGVAIGVGYFVNGRYVTWGAVAGPLAAGAAVIVGTNAAAWVPPAAGTYTVTAVVDDVNRFAESNEANNARAVPVAVASSAPPPSNVQTVPFDSMPAWSDTHDASWGAPAAWAAAGGSLQTSRSAGGSSTRTLVFLVPANRTIDVSASLKCPAFAGGYWMELGVRAGSHSADDFDANPSAWTIVQKFSASGQNGNGNVWTRYSRQVSTGASTVITVGFKLGSSGSGPAVGWDTLRLSY
jgi:hypothetical protein